MPSPLAIVGQAPSRTSDPSRPLSGNPTRSRLVALLGVSEEVYDAIPRYNLLPVFPGRSPGGKGDRFDLVEARRRAEGLGLFLLGHRVVFLGSKVAAAFRHPKIEPLAWEDDDMTGGEVALLPHVSGVSRWWNDPSNRLRATRFMRKIGREIA